MSRCPICDNKPFNCDCTREAKDDYELDILEALQISARKVVVASILKKLEPHLALYDEKNKRNAIILYKTIETILKEVIDE